MRRKAIQVEFLGQGKKRFWELDLAVVVCCMVDFQSGGDLCWR
jgi:hypothetical protein